MNTMKVHQAVARSFFENGVTTMFGLTGDANMYIVNSYTRDYGGTFVAAANEAGATMMALGYASISGKAGVCTVTYGPGVTNTITGLVEGVRGSLPLVLVTGETSAIDRESAQRVRTRDFARDAGAGFELLRSADTVAQDIARALRRAMVEHRPIVFSVPMELDWADVEDYRPELAHVPESRAVVSASSDLDNAIGIIAAARRPVIIVGRGATSDEAKAAILRLARRIEAPLATTIKAKDLFRGDEYYLGSSGTVSRDVAVDTIMTSDCIIAFGASLNKYTLSHGTFLTGKRVIQVNLEPAEVGKNVKVDAGLIGDPAGVADLLVHWLDEAEIPSSGCYTAELRERIAADVPRTEALTDQGDGTVDYLQALLRLNRIFPENRVVVTDAGRFVYEIWRNITVPDPQSFLTPLNFASIGLGLPHAIGAAYAAPGRPIVLFTGDGGFMNGGLVEFNTAVRHRTDLVVVVCNDGSYGAEQHKFVARQMDPGLVIFDWPDFAPVATALGGHGVTIRCEADWEAAEEAIRADLRPLLIDLKLDPSRIAWDR